MQRRDTGRPELVYGRKCPSDLYEHEVRVADLALYFKEFPMERGVKVGRTEADGLLVIAGRRCYVEVDNSGKMTAKQMEMKWKRYAGVDGDIFVVAVKEQRMERLRAGAALVKNAALFTTFERLLSGMPEPWIDWFGHTVRI